MNDSISTALADLMAWRDRIDQAITHLTNAEAAMANLTLAGPGRQARTPRGARATRAPRAGSSTPPPAGKRATKRRGGAAKAAPAGLVCDSCGKAPFSKKLRRCEDCGKNCCGKCGLKGQSVTCRSCRGPKKATKRLGKAASAENSAQPASDGKCVGCGKAAREWKNCESCGARYCEDRCLREHTDCPSCRATARGD